MKDRHVAEILLQLANNIDCTNDDDDDDDDDIGTSDASYHDTKAMADHASDDDRHDDQDDNYDSNSDDDVDDIDDK